MRILLGVVGLPGCEPKDRQLDVGDEVRVDVMVVLALVRPAGSSMEGVPMFGNPPLDAAATAVVAPTSASPKRAILPTCSSSFQK